MPPDVHKDHPGVSGSSFSKPERCLLKLTGYFVKVCLCRIQKSDCLLHLFFSFSLPKMTLPKCGFFISIFLYWRFFFFSLHSLKSSAFEFVFVGSINWRQILCFLPFTEPLLLKMTDACLFPLLYFEQISNPMPWKRNIEGDHGFIIIPLALWCACVCLHCRLRLQIHSFVCLQWAVIRLLLMSWRVTIYLLHWNTTEVIFFFFFFVF